MTQTTNNTVSWEEASGLAPAEPQGMLDKVKSFVGIEKPVATPTGKDIVSWDQAAGITPLDEELKALQTPMGAVKDVSKGIAGRAASLLTATGDLVVGAPAAIAGHLMNLGTRLYGTTTNENRKLIGQAGELAEDLGEIKIPGTKIRIPLEPLKTPLQSLLKMATGVEPWDQSAVEHLMDKGAKGIEKVTQGKVTSEDAKLSMGILMDAAGWKGLKETAKGYVDWRTAPKKQAQGIVPEGFLSEEQIMSKEPVEAAKAPGPEAQFITTQKQVKEIFDNAKKVGGNPVTQLFDQAKREGTLPVGERNAPMQAQAAKAWMDDPKIQAAAEVEPWKRTPEQKATLDKWLSSWGPMAVAGGVGLGLMQWLGGNDEDLMMNFGMGAAAMGAIKQKGGMWHPEAVERLATPLARKLADMNSMESVSSMRESIEAARNDGNLSEKYAAKIPLLAWADSRIKNYLNKHAGTEGDPLKDVEIPFEGGTKRWESLMDVAVASKAARDIDGYTYRPSTLPESITRAPAMERIWNFEGSGPRGWHSAGQAITSYLSHVGDYLRQNVDPVKLQQYDLVRAVKETAANDARVAKEMEKAAAASTKDLPVYKEYPDGMKWVELKLGDKELTAEQVKSVRKMSDSELKKAIRESDGYTPDDVSNAEGYFAIGADGKPIKNSYTGELASGRTPQEARLAGQLAEEGNQMGHCVGGYCEGVASGESKIFSLRDKKGKSHVTVEVAPPSRVRPGTTVDDFARVMGDEFILKKVGQTPNFRVFENKVAALPEYKQWVKEQPQDVLQIKGKQNRAPVAEYLPYVQDFVKGGKWGEVGDLGNTGLTDLIHSKMNSIPFRQLAEELYPDQRFLNETEAKHLHKEGIDRTLRDQGKSSSVLPLAAGAAIGAGLLLADHEPDEFTALAVGMVATPGFKNWFKNSKVVNENGRPKVVYHGTKDAFEHHDLSKSGTHTDAPSAKGAIFFTDNPKVAEGYTKYSPESGISEHENTQLNHAYDNTVINGEKAAVIQQRLEHRLHELFDTQYEGKGKWKTEAAKLEINEIDKQQKALAKEVEAGAGHQSIRPVFLDIKNPLVKDMSPHADAFGAGDFSYDAIVKDTIAEAKRKGNDGVIFENIFENLDKRTSATTYVVFDPKQVKSVFEQPSKKISYAKLEEPKLLEAMKAGDQGAFTEMYNRTQSAAHRAAASFGDAAQDVVQRSYEKAFRAAAEGDFRGDSKFSTFLYRVIQNEGKNRVAFEKNRPTESIDAERADGTQLADELGHNTTPETTALNQKLADRMQAALDKLQPDFRRVFEAAELEGLSYEEIAAREGVPIGTVRSRLSRAKESLQNSLKDYKDLQAGNANIELVAGIAAIGGGAAIAAAIGDPQNSLRNAVYGALAGGAIGTGAGRSALKAAIKSPDTALGLISTRLGNINQGLKYRLRLHEHNVLKEIDTANDAVLPFLQAVKKLDSEQTAIADKALLNGNREALVSIPSLRASLPAVDKILKHLEEKLQGLGRFGEGVINYFPRLVKDFEGLKKALGQEVSLGLEKALAEAEAKMIKKEGRSLTDIEQSIITNRYLYKEDQTSFQQGWAKARKIREIPEGLMKYYEKPADSLLRYISGAINDIETAKFFGRDLAVNKAGKKTFTDVDNSIGNLTNRLMQEGKITREQSWELRDILKARFEGGEKGMSTGWGNVRNITNTALLGNVASAATQIGDSLMTVYHHGLVPTLQAVTEKIAGRQKITPKQLGLINHIAEELSEQGASGKALHVAMKYSGFHAIDMFAKGLGLNAAVIKLAKQVQSVPGEVKFRAKYGEAFGEEIGQVISDLKAGRRSKNTDFLAFNELSDAQPISKAEMPEAYLKHPDGRLLYQLKTYMLKQTDIVRRDAYQEIAKGTTAGIMRGTKNLAALATVYALANVPGDVVKDIISGRPIDPFSTPKMVENIFQTFGVNRYAAERLGQGKVTDVAIGIATPPIRVLEDIAKLNAKSLSYFPFAGRPLYDRFGGGNEKREIYETRMHNSGKSKADKKALSPEAKAFAKQQRLEKKLKKMNSQ